MKSFKQYLFEANKQEKYKEEKTGSRLSDYVNAPYDDPNFQRISRRFSGETIENLNNFKGKKLINFVVKQIENKKLINLIFENGNFSFFIKD